MNRAVAPGDPSEVDCDEKIPPWLKRLLWAGAAFLSVLLAVHVDARVDGWVTGMSWPGLKPIASWLSESAKGQWPLIAGLLTWWIAGRLRRPDWQRLAVIFLVASSLAGISAAALRGVVGRARPSNTQEQGWFGPYHDGEWMMDEYEYNSFPSGHTATAAGCAFALVLAGSRFGWLAGVWAMAVAWSRIYCGAHHLSDTVASLFLGLAWAWLACRWYRRIRPLTAPAAEANHSATPPTFSGTSIRVDGGGR